MKIKSLLKCKHQNTLATLAALATLTAPVSPVSLSPIPMHSGHPEYITLPMHGCIIQHLIFFLFLTRLLVARGEPGWLGWQGGQLARVVGSVVWLGWLGQRARVRQHWWQNPTNKARIGPCLLFFPKRKTERSLLGSSCTNRNRSGITYRVSLV